MFSLVLIYSILLYPVLDVLVSYISLCNYFHYAKIKLFLVSVYIYRMFTYTYSLITCTFSTLCEPQLWLVKSRREERNDNNSTKKSKKMKENLLKIQRLMFGNGVNLQRRMKCVASPSRKVGKSNYYQLHKSSIKEHMRHFYSTNRVPISQKSRAAYTENLLPRKRKMQESYAKHPTEKQQKVLDRYHANPS